MSRQEFKEYVGKIVRDLEPFVGDAGLNYAEFKLACENPAHPIHLDILRAFNQGILPAIVIKDFQSSIFHYIIAPNQRTPGHG